MNLRRKTLALAAVWALLPGWAAAQDSWPNKPVSLVVPYPPGGTSDVIGRQRLNIKAE